MQVVRQKGLVSHISRHIRSDKPCRWHICYLTEVGRAIAIFWIARRETINASGPDDYHRVKPQHPLYKVWVRRIPNVSLIYIFSRFRMFTR